MQVISELAADASVLEKPGQLSWEREKCHSEQKLMQLRECRVLLLPVAIWRHDGAKSYSRATLPSLSTSRGISIYKQSRALARKSLAEMQ